MAASTSRASTRTLGAVAGPATAGLQHRRGGLRRPTRSTWSRSRDRDRSIARCRDRAVSGRRPAEPRARSLEGFRYVRPAGGPRLLPRGPRTRWSSGCRGRCSRRSRSAIVGGRATSSAISTPRLRGRPPAWLRSGWMRHVRRQGLRSCSPRPVWGVAIAAFGSSTGWPALLSLAIAGAADDVSACSATRSCSRATPDRDARPPRGIEFAQVASAPTLGNVEAGIVASFTSLRFSVVSGGVLCVAGTVVIGALLPALVRYDAAAGQRGVIRRGFFARSVHEVAPELIGVTLLVDGVGGRSSRSRHTTRRTRPATASRPHRAQAVDVRAARARVRVPLVRHPLVPEPRLRAGRARRAPCSSARSSRRTGSTRCASAAGWTTSALCSGPGQLCQALGVTRAHDGLAARRAAVRAPARAEEPDRHAGRGSGSRAPPSSPWRYGLAGSRFLSRPFPRLARPCT